MSPGYLQGLRAALDTERRRVEELEAEVLFLRKELAAFKVITGGHRLSLYFKY